MTMIRGFLLLQIMSFWPVWEWYGKRLTDGSDEPWGILALLAAIGIGMLRGRWQSPPFSALYLSTLIVALYGILYGWLPFLLRGFLCMLALSLVLSPALFGRRIQPGITGLLILSLPLIASLQFYGGFPIRFLTAHLSAWFVALIGFPVEVQGTLMYWAGEVIAVDAPCAGIKMLWSGLFVNFCLATWFDLNLFRTWIATTFTMASIFTGNVLRAAALFFVESGIVHAPSWSHQGIGVLVFLCVTAAILTVHSRLQKGVRECAN